MAISLFSCLLSIAAALCLYLTAANQWMLRAPLSSAWRYLGALLAIAGVILWTQTLSIAAALFAAITTWMAVFVLVPYLGWYRAR